jgi:major membrane immunogen (membrane-anchored lipoprotein)
VGSRFEMPFEAFLNETHARPLRAARFGFIASIAMHGPPITVFVTTWLTHALLIGSSALYPDTQSTRGTYYIPISVYGHGPGSGGPGVEPGGGSTGNGGNRPRAGLAGRSGRAGRRGLVAPREVKPLPKKTAWNDPFMAGSYASTDAHGSLGHDSGSGDDQAGTGHGSGNNGQGPGGPAGGGPGNGMLADTQLDRAKEKEKAAKVSHGESHGTGKDRAAEGDDDHEVGTELDVLMDDGRAVRAAYISQDSAAYYRTEDSNFPRLYEAYWPAGRREWAMLFRICVSTEGTVSNVVVLKSASEEVDRLVGAAITSWRYRPRIVDGSPRPFCHPIRIIYAR